MPALRESSRGRGRRESAARKRAACIDAITCWNWPWARAGVERWRQAYATTPRRSSSSCDGLVSELQGLWETAALGIALRCERVLMPLPVKLRRVRSMGWRGRCRCAQAMRLRCWTKKRSSWARRSTAWMGALEPVQRHRTERGAGGPPWPATSRSMGVGEYGGPDKSWRCSTAKWTVSNSLPGQLLDGSLISAGMAHRLMAGRRYIAPLNLEKRGGVMASMCHRAAVSVSAPTFVQTSAQFRRTFPGSTFSMLDMQTLARAISAAQALDLQARAADDEQHHAHGHSRPRQFRRAGASEMSCSDARDGHAPVFAAGPARRASAVDADS